MKKVLITLLITTAFFTAYSQIVDTEGIKKNSENDLSKSGLDNLLKQDFINFIGKKITADSNLKKSFYGSIVSINEGNPFRYKKTDADSFSLIKINFEIPTIFITKRHKIVAIGFRKKYTSTDSAYRTKMLNQDFDTLKEYFSVKYKTEFEIRGQASNPRFYNDAAVWKIKKRRIQLIRHYGELIGKNNLFTSYLEVLFL